MKVLMSTVAALSLAFSGGDREEGLRLYREGRYAEAQAAFTRALADAPGSAELQWNLALAAWRAGDLITAETAAEKYAAASREAVAGRHRGMLGAIRYAEAAECERQADAALTAGPPAPGLGDAAPADPMPLLERGVQKALEAKDHFVRAVQADPTVELVRNTERAISKLEELKEKLEELAQQRQQDPQREGQDGDPSDQEQGDQQQGDQDQSGDPQEQSGDRKEGGEPEQGEQQEDPAGEGEPREQTKPGEGEATEPPEPEPEPESAEQAPQPQPGEQPGEEASDPTPSPQQGEDDQAGRMDAPEPEPADPRTDAPGEGGVGRELSPEQAKRLLDRLKQLEQEMKQARARARVRRKSVERDW